MYVAGVMVCGAGTVIFGYVYVCVNITLRVYSGPTVRNAHQSPPE